MDIPCVTGFFSLIFQVGPAQKAVFQSPVPTDHELPEIPWIFPWNHRHEIIIIFIPEMISPKTLLVGGWLKPTPLKDTSSSIGMMIFPTEWKKNVPVTTNQFLFQSNSCPVYDLYLRWYPTWAVFKIPLSFHTGWFMGIPHSRIMTIPMKNSIPRWSMYGIFTYIWVIYRVNVGKYIIHGSSGISIIIYNPELMINQQAFEQPTHQLICLFSLQSHLIHHPHHICF